MTVTIKNAHLGGSVTIPSSKSEAHRYLICAAFADRATDVAVHGVCSDIEATVDCLSAIGAGIDKTDFGYRITPISSVNKNPLLKCRDSGSTLRFLLPISAALGCDADILMDGRLPERPLSPLDEEMLRHGTTLDKEGNILHVRGKMSGNTFKLPANISSQFISGILMALPLLGGGTVELLKKIESAGYINMTVDSMRTFGISVKVSDNVISVEGDYKSPGRVTAHGDWSGAAFWVCAGALSSKGITCHGLDLASTQGDRAILKVVADMGARIIYGEKSVTVSSAPLTGSSIDASDIPDLVPVISALAAGACGITEISGAARLRIKESDRLAVMREVLTNIGADITEKDDGLTVVGKPRLIGGKVDSHRDHRIPMSIAVASMMCEGEVKITGAECVSKSYPAFWDDFVTLGGEIEVIH